jgi:hypothetical protein
LQNEALEFPVDERLEDKRGYSDVKRSVFLPED